MGRSMKMPRGTHCRAASSSQALLRVRGDLSPVRQLVHAVQHNFVARLQTLCYFGFVAVGRAELDASRGHGRIGAHHENVGVTRIALNSGGGDEQRTMLLLKQQAGINELVRKQLVVLIWKARPQADGAGRLIDLVVDRGQRADAKPVLLIPVPASTTRFSPAIIRDRTGGSWSSAIGKIMLIGFIWVITSKAVPLLACT